jgi:hypothetical protein
VVCAFRFGIDVVFVIPDSVVNPNSRAGNPGTILCETPVSPLYSRGTPIAFHENAVVRNGEEVL